MFVYDGKLRDDLGNSALTEYMNSMAKRLRLKADEVRPGHYRSFDHRRLRELITGCIDEKKTPKCPRDD